jgi:signal transduction histidine kinase
LDQVLKATRQAKNLVGQIMAFSRRLETEKKPILLKSIVQQSINLLRVSLPATIEIYPQLRSEAIILADPTQISQVIMNLCTNAFHAMENSRRD